MPRKETHPAPDFEKAIERLEEIVRQMESDQMPLNTLVDTYEEGTKLVQLCQETLDSAEKRIETVTRRTPDASVAAEETAPPTASPAQSDNDARLF